MAPVTDVEQFAARRSDWDHIVSDPPHLERDPPRFDANLDELRRAIRRRYRRAFLARMMGLAIGAAVLVATAELLEWAIWGSTGWARLIAEIVR
jgi:hypothetical protein